MDASPESHPENVLDVLPAAPRGAGWLWSSLAVLGYALASSLILLIGGVSGLLLLLAVVAAVNSAVWLHGLGHWLTARLTGLPVQTWSLGFGPALFGCQFQSGGTLFKLGLVPLGGYVRLATVAPASTSGEQPRWRGLAFHAAGILASLLVLLGGLLAIGYQHEERLAGVIGAVEPGSPAWEVGARSGATIHRIGDIEEPSFNDLKLVVPLTDYLREDLAFEFAGPGEPLVRTTIRPRRRANDAYPVIGVAPPKSARLYGLRVDEQHQRPAYIGSAADRAVPPFAFGDEIIGTTDRDAPETVRALPTDPRNPTAELGDYFELRRRMRRLAGREMTVRVRRAGAGEIDIRVPPAFHATLGLRMNTGWITAVRPDSPADRAGVQAVNQRVNGRKAPGDYLNAVEVVQEDGGTLRWAREPRAVPAEGIVEKPLDPLRLPFELEQWAARLPGRRQVTLWVMRRPGVAEEQLELKADWDDRWTDSEEIPMTLDSPLSIPALGLAYAVENTVVGVESESPATRGVDATGAVVALQPLDTITSVRFHQADGQPARRAIEMADAQWAYIFDRLQYGESKRVELEVKRGQERFVVTLEAQPDPSWPRTERGLVHDFSYRYPAARGVGEALSLGLSRSALYLGRIAFALRDAIVQSFTLRTETLGGPVVILAVTESQGPRFLYAFLHWLVLVSAVLFFVNCLPIPILDAGNGVRLMLGRK